MCFVHELLCGAVLIRWSSRVLSVYCLSKVRKVSSAVSSMRTGDLFQYESKGIESREQVLIVMASSVGVLVTPSYSYLRPYYHTSAC